MLNLFFSIVHSKPNLDVFIKRFVTTEPTKDLSSFFDVLQEFHSKKFTSEGIEKLVVSKVMVLIEPDFPIWLCNITTHLVHHMVEKIADNGPLYSSWMSPFERMNSRLTRRAIHRSTTDECIMETAEVITIFFIWSFFHILVKSLYFSVLHGTQCAAIIFYLHRRLKKQHISK